MSTTKDLPRLDNMPDLHGLSLNPDGTECPKLNTTQQLLSAVVVNGPCGPGLKVYAIPCEVDEAPPVEVFCGEFRLCANTTTTLADLITTFTDAGAVLNDGTTAASAITQITVVAAPIGAKCDIAGDTITATTTDIKIAYNGAVIALYEGMDTEPFGDGINPILPITIEPAAGSFVEIKLKLK